MSRKSHCGEECCGWLCTYGSALGVPASLAVFLSFLEERLQLADERLSAAEQANQAWYIALSITITISHKYPHKSCYDVIACVIVALTGTNHRHCAASPSAYPWILSPPNSARSTILLGANSVGQAKVPLRKRGQK